MMDFIMNNVNVLGVLHSDCWVIGQDFYDELQYIFNAIRLIVPCLVMVLCTVDMLRAVISQDEKGFQESLNRTIKRVSIGVAIFFIPLLLDIILGFTGVIAGTCSIG